MNKCRTCGSTRLTQLLDLGRLPVAHRFIKSPGGGRDEFMHPMIAHLCEVCALIQILDPIPREELYRDYNFCFSAWKPQPHMADEIKRIVGRVGVDSLIVELGSNDGVFLNELKSAGCRRLAGVEPNRAANAESRKTGASIYEEFFSEDAAERIKKDLGPASLIVSRQAVEHIPDLDGLFAGLRKLVAPKGWLMLEVPDFEGPLSYGDISGLWEEHVNYFTEATFCDLLERQGFGAIDIVRYPFSGGAIMVLAQLGAPKNPQRTESIEATKRLALAFAGRAEHFRRSLVGLLEQNRKSGRPNSFYGTGCRANMLINAWKLAPLLDVLVDDQKEKQGYFLPGTSLKVEPSSALYGRVGDCFMAVNAENEDKVVARHQDFVSRGGRFLSVNSPSPRLKDLDVSPLPA
jgi:SAM-dependent methyltransferase